MYLPPTTGGVENGVGGNGGNGGTINEQNSISATKKSSSKSSTGGNGGTINEQNSISMTKKSSSKSSNSSKPSLSPTPPILTPFVSALSWAGAI